MKRKKTKKRKTKKTKKRKATKSRMNSGYKVHQLNLFVGQLSYIFRTDSRSEMQAFTGQKEITADGVVSLMSSINNKLFGNKPATVAEVDREPETKTVDYVGQLKERLRKLGAKSQAQQVKLFNKKTGWKIKSFKNMTPMAVQQGLMILLRGKK